MSAAYRLDGSEAAWLQAIVEQAGADLGIGNGLYAFSGNESVPSLATSPVFVEQSLTPAFRARLLELNETAPTAIFDLLRNRP